MPDAKRDLLKAKEWYEEKCEGLGEKFSKAILKTVDSLREYPKRFNQNYGEYRTTLVIKFPFFLFFTLVGQTIIIRRVLHAHSNFDRLI